MAFLVADGGVSFPKFMKVYKKIPFLFTSQLLWLATAFSCFHSKVAIAEKTSNDVIFLQYDFKRGKLTSVCFLLSRLMF